MLEFFANYGIDLAAISTAATGIIVTGYNIIKMFTNNKKVNKSLQEMNQNIAITQQGIVEGFKNAKIPNEWKISISKQVDTKLTEWKDEFMKMLAKNQQTLLKINVMALKVLSYTAAVNKLDDDEKALLNDIVNQVSDEDSTIEV